jgi:group I intron endonuclease
MIIYKCENKISGKVYIGQSVKSLEDRKEQHIKKSNSPKSKFHKALKSYGVDNFNWEIIDTANSKDELNQKEMHYILEYNSMENGYNMVNGGTGGYNKFAVNANRKKRKGKTYEEIYGSLDTISRLKKIHKESYEKAKLDKWNFKNLSKDERLFMAKLGNKIRTMNGYKHSAETKQKIGEAQKGITNEDRYGKVEAEKLNKRISEATKEAMKSVDRELLGKKSVEARKLFWNNKHTEDRNMILELKSKDYSVKKICAKLNISYPTYYARMKELKKMGLFY